jgi:hypothetical protein
LLLPDLPAGVAEQRRSVQILITVFAFYQIQVTSGAFHVQIAPFRRIVEIDIMRSIELLVTSLMPFRSAW